MSSLCGAIVTVPAPRVPDGPWVRTDEPLLWLGGAGHETRLNASYGYDCSQRQDVPHYCLQLTLSGCGFYERDGSRTRLLTGMAFLDQIPGPFHYGYPPQATEPYEQVYVNMLGQAAEQWCRRIIGAFGNVLTFGEDNAIAPLMLAIARQHPQDSLHDRYVISGQLYHLLMTVLSVLNQSRVATNPRVARALGLMAERAADPAFGVAPLARELGCSREYLSRQFRRATGVSPSDYLMQHRLRLAAREMRAGDDKLQRIARRCGFSDANYLCRVFRQHFGITPAQFRARPWIVI